MMDRYKHKDATHELFGLSTDTSKISKTSMSCLYIDLCEQHEKQTSTFMLENDSFLYIYSGFCYITIDNKEYKASAGDALILRANHECKYVHNDKGCRMMSVNFQGRMTDEMLIAYGLSESAYYPSSHCLPYCNLLKSAAESAEKNFSEFQNEMLVFLLHIFQHLSNEIDVHTPDADRIRRNIMRKLYMPDLTVHSLAKERNYSSTKLQHVFQNAYGISIRKFIIQKRLERAKELLLSTSHSVTEIAASVGYGSRKHLDSLFVKYEKITAAEYRRKNKNT